MATRVKFKKYHRPGTSPGTLVPPAQAPAEVQIRLINYGPDHFEEKLVKDVEECAAYRQTSHNLWISIVGLGRVDVLERLGSDFNLHPLALEDVLNIGQRPKFDDYEDYIFFILRLSRNSRDLSRDSWALETEQFSFFLGKNFLITIEEFPGSPFDAVLDRLRKGRPKIRGGGVDYLAYALIDSAVDSFFPVMEQLGEQIEALEDEVVEEPDEETLTSVNQLKRDVLTLRRMLWPMRDLVNTLLRDDTPLLSAQTRLYLRDCYDHSVQLIDMLETHREISTGIMEVYLSSLSQRMNEIMKVLTVIATIFIPLTFIVGIYGMNFDPDISPWNMPELTAYYGYPIVMGLMLVIALFMLAYFKRRGWF